MMFEDEVSLTP